MARFGPVGRAWGRCLSPGPELAQMAPCPTRLNESSEKSPSTAATDDGATCTNGLAESPTARRTRYPPCVMGREEIKDRPFVRVAQLQPPVSDIVVPQR